MIKLLRKQHSEIVFRGGVQAFFKPTMKRCKQAIKNTSLLTFCLLALTLTTQAEPGMNKGANSKKAHWFSIALPGEQNTVDQASILQKCLDLPELLTYFPKNSDNSYKKVVVMQYPVSFQSEVSVSKFGENVLFLGRNEISDTNTEAFFMVKTLTISENSATVIFEYNNNTGTPKSIEGTLNLQKAGSGWNVVNSNFNRK